MLVISCIFRICDGIVKGELQVTFFHCEWEGIGRGCLVNRISLRC